MSSQIELYFYDAVSLDEAIQIIELAVGAGNATVTSVNSFTAKTTPVDADVALIADSADSFLNKKVTWANIKATLKTYFDGIYTTTSAVASQISTALTNYITSTALATALLDYVTIQSGYIKGQFGLHKVYTPTDASTVSIDYTLANSSRLDCTLLGVGDTITIEFTSVPASPDGGFEVDPEHLLIITTGADPNFDINWPAGVIDPTLIASKHNETVVHKLDSGAYWHLSPIRSYDVSP